MFGLAGLVLAGDLSSARAPLVAMACCAKTHGGCAGVKSPDTCCRGMGHVGVTPASTTPPNGPTWDAPVMRAILAQTATGDSGVGSAQVFVCVAFKRPHDPPHLHAFTLLI